jgi:hypothetical protein
VSYLLWKIKHRHTDGLPAEAWEVLVTKYEGKFHNVKEKREFPREWKATFIQTNLGETRYYRGISLLKILGQYIGEIYHVD